MSLTKLHFPLRSWEKHWHGHTSKFNCSWLLAAAAAASACSEADSVLSVHTCSVLSAAAASLRLSAVGRWFNLNPSRSSAIPLPRTRATVCSSESSRVEEWQCYRYHVPVVSMECVECEKVWRIEVLSPSTSD